MDNVNYRFPFNPVAVMKDNSSMETCGTAESIAQNIMLLIITKKGENRYDEDYGNEVWNVEFDNGISAVKWEEIFVKSLKKQILKYETRIKNPDISAQISIVEHSYDTKGFTEVKKKVKVAINAVIEASDERFSFATELFLSPMSID